MPNLKQINLLTQTYISSSGESSPDNPTYLKNDCVYPLVQINFFNFLIYSTLRPVTTIEILNKLIQTCNV